jgi:hypothetical protein
MLFGVDMVESRVPSACRGVYLSPFTATTSAFHPFSSLWHFVSCLQSPFKPACQSFITDQTHRINYMENPPSITHGLRLATVFLPGRFVVNV